MSIQSVMSSTISSSVVPFSYCLQSSPPSRSLLMNWLFASGDKYWSFSFSISPSNEYSGLISFRFDLFDFLAVQGTLESLLQYHTHSWKASILHCSAYFIGQLLHAYVTTRKTIALTIRNFSPKECSNYRTIALISHASKVMLKILQVRLQQYVNHELPDVQAGFRKGRGTRDQIANIH